MFCFLNRFSVKRIFFVLIYSIPFLLLCFPNEVTSSSQLYLSAKFSLR